MLILWQERKRVRIPYKRFAILFISPGKSRILLHSPIAKLFDSTPPVVFNVSHPVGKQSRKDEKNRKQSEKCSRDEKFRMREIKIEFIVGDDSRMLLGRKHSCLPPHHPRTRRFRSLKQTQINENNLCLESLLNF